MKHEAMNTLRSAQVKRIMQSFFTNAAPLFCCRANSRRDALCEDLLTLVLEVSGGAQHADTCRYIISQTNALQNAADWPLLYAEELSIAPELLCYFDRKAECLRQPGLDTVGTMDAEMLPDTVRQAGSDGYAWAIRTGACLNWMEADPWCSRENALRMWKILAFSGDLFAMAALEYGLRITGHEAQAQVWQQTRQICEAAGKQFLTILPADMAAQVSKEASEVAQLILSMRGVLRGSKGCLPMSVLQYAAESRDSMAQKLHTLCTGQDGFQLRLIQEQKNDGRQFGF